MSTETGRAGNRWLGVTASAIVLFVGSVIPLPPRHNPDFGLCGPDKFLHLLGHAALAAAIVTALADDGPPLRVAVLATASSTVYGIGTELLQEAIPGREFERGDVGAGFLGSLLGVVLWRRIAHRRRSR